MEAGGERRVCVTGAGGYLASWLVKLLLSNGYKVHGTVRDPSDEKNAHLKKLERASENLELFKADLLDYDSVSAAIKGCEGVFHVASPVPADQVTDPEVEVIAPAVTGTSNVLKACVEAEIKRVVVVSSTAAVAVNPDWAKDKVMDEECWSDKDYCKKIEKWYCLSKTLAESMAWEYAQQNGLNVITVCPSYVFGPLLQPTVNASSLWLLYIIKGGDKPFENKRWYVVDVRDVADALLLVYEKPDASGRYICAPHGIKMSDLVDMLKRMYPCYPYTSYFEADDTYRLSDEKLKQLGWKCRTLNETLIDAIEYYQEIGLLSKD